MSTDTVPGCALNLSPATLSSWRDGALPPAETQHIEAHIAACPACRDRLAEYEAIAGKLAAIRVPDPVGGYGKTPRAGLAASRGLSDRHPMRFAGGLGALAAAVLVTLLFAQLFHSMGGTSSGNRTSPTATATSHPEQTTLPPGLTPGVLDTRPVPAGWSRVLDGQRFDAITTSPADPHTLAGCPLPVDYPIAVPPVLALSTDGGVTWQIHPIPGADATTSCAVLADTEKAGIYILGPNDEGTDIAPPVYETTNSGRTWQTLTPPAGYTMGLGSLVGGYLTAWLVPSTGGTDHIGQLSPNGTWTFLHAFDAGNPSSFGVDPENPAHIYVAVDAENGTNGLALAVTSDRGITAQIVHTWNVANLLEIWTATKGQVVVQPLGPSDNLDLWFSSNAGASWREVISQRGSSQVFVEPDSDVVTLYRANAYGSFSGGRLSELNLTSGKLEPLVSTPDFFNGISCTATTSVLVCGDMYGTYRLPLSPTS